MIQILGQLEPPVADYIKQSSSSEEDIAMTLLIQVKEVSRLCVSELS